MYHKLTLQTLALQTLVQLLWLPALQTLVQLLWLPALQTLVQLLWPPALQTLVQLLSQPALQSQALYMPHAPFRHLSRSSAAPDTPNGPGTPAAA
jgi:hypothetical protein